MTGLKERLLTALFPNICYLCGDVLPPEESLCRDCRQQAPYVLPPVCDWCGRGEDRCSCGGRHRCFDRCVSPFYYEGRAEGGIFRLKERGYVPVVRGLAAEMREMVRREYGGIGFHMVTGVPLYSRDKRRRGFDHAHLLAQELAAQLKIPYIPLLKKLYATRPQKELSALERSGNLLGAFDVLDPALLPGRTVLLVDDVITTGSTLDECAKMLKIFGAQEVYAVTAAASVLQKAENDV